MFDHWAQPVTSRRWAIVCTVLGWAYFRGHLRAGPMGRWKHRAWERACGLPGLAHTR